jgi:hypothetical protein
VVKTNAIVIVIAEAGSLIHLDELKSLQILSDFGKIIVPKKGGADPIIHKNKANQDEKKLGIH